MIINDILHRYCTCCCNPNRDILDDDTGQQQPIRPYSNLVTPVTQTAEGVEVAPVVLSHDQGNIQQPQLHPVIWHDHQLHHTPVDLEVVSEVHKVVKRPVNVEQNELFVTSWNNEGGARASDEWGGDKVWEEINDEQDDKELPLPWEGRKGPVFFDGKTVGPSWAQKEDDSFPQQHQAAAESSSSGKAPLVTAVTKIVEAIKHPKEAEIENPVEEEAREATVEQQQGEKTDTNKQNRLPETEPPPAAAEKPYSTAGQEPALEPLRKEETPLSKEEDSSVMKPEELQAEVENARQFGGNKRLDESAKGNLVYHQQEEKDFSKPTKRQEQKIVGSSATGDDKSKPVAATSAIDEEGNEEYNK